MSVIWNQACSWIPEEQKEFSLTVGEKSGEATVRKTLLFPSGIFRTVIDEKEFFTSQSIPSIMVEFKKLFSSIGYEFYDSFPLRVNDPTLLLLNSTVAVFKDEMMSDQLLNKRAISQFCFRNKQKEADYLYSFNMIGLSSDIAYLNDAYKDTVLFLEKCGIPRDRMHVVLNQDDLLLAKQTLQLFSKSHVHYLNKNNEKYNVDWNFGHPSFSGKGLTIVASLSEDDRLDHMSKSFVPLGNIIIVSNGAGDRYVDVGFGVECILSYFYNGEIFSIPFYSEQLNSLKQIKWIEGKEKTILKSLCGFIALFSEGILPGSKGESYISTRIQNDLFAVLYKDKKTISDINDIFSALRKFYTKEELVLIEAVHALLIRNFQDYIKCIEKNIPKAKKLIKKHLLNRKDKIFIFENIKGTFGLPEEIINEVIMATMATAIESKGSIQSLVKISKMVTTRWSVIDTKRINEVKFGRGTILADDIAKAFICFFVNQENPRDHFMINGASVLPKDDPTLLFINSGMAAIKPFFTGELTPSHPRLCNVQPCIRTNDIDDIGDMHHLSFFHMLGSWSIGNYYKEDAIHLAYDLLVNVLGFPKEKLYVTVFEGDERMGVEPDYESIEHWKRVGFEENHIVPLPAEDNFWGPAGETGPCGPCTEIFYDMGDSFAPPYVPGKGETFDTKNRYVEIWNGGVFMQYFMYQDKSIKPLSFRSVDTGSGLERMTMTMNGYSSVYETDLLKPIYDIVERNLPTLEVKSKRMITDHIRTAAYLISEGISPGNTGREYIVRKLIRKSVTSITNNGYKIDVLSQIVPHVVTFLGQSYPHFEENEQAIMEIIYSEAHQFVSLLEKGIKLVEKNLPIEGEKSFSPQIAHYLVTTKGLPLEILSDCLIGKGLNLDMEAFSKLEDEHKQASKGRISQDSSEVLSLQTLDYISRIEKTEFTGYFSDTGETKIMALIQDGILVENISNQLPFQFILNSTPFYAEGGGQCGDRGLGETVAGAELTIIETKSMNGVYLHTAHLTKGALNLGEGLKVKVSDQHRLGVKRNHSATHLIHFALYQMIGMKTLQQGSLVEATRLRFDFKLDTPLSDADILRIESIVNNCILSNFEIVTSINSYQEAKELGAIGMFGEKYGERVRIVKMGPSLELCGGTHASRTGDLGLFLIQSEKSIAKGIRRIIAVTGPEALQQVQSRRALITNLTQILGSPEEGLVNKISQIDLRKSRKVKSLEEQKLPEVTISCLKSFEFASSKKFEVYKTNEESRKTILEIADKNFTENPTCCGLLFVFETSKGTNLVCVSKKLEQNQIDASGVISYLMEHCSGKGGGNKDIAQCNIGHFPNFLEFLSSEVIEKFITS